jgi:hypothetical protein
MSAQYLATMSRRIELVLDNEELMIIPLYYSHEPVRDLLNLVNYTDELSIFYVVHNPQADLWGFVSIPRTKKVTKINHSNWSNMK